MKKLVVAGMLGFAALCGLQATAHSMPLLVPNAPVKTGDVNRPLILVQSADPTIRIQELEEQIRTLNGRIEEMSFQLLQMQEQQRKTQEDNEFRFQELEKKNGKKTGSLETTQTPETDVTTIIEQNQPTPGAETGNDATASTETGQSQETLGSIELDNNGNPVSATINDNADNGSGTVPAAGTGATQETASLGSESEAYQAAYGHVLSGDYSLAEQEFQSYITQYPSSAKIADANFWLGEALYSQGKYNESAKTFLNAHQTYGKSPKAAEMLLKLGMSLAALDNRDTACATLREVSKRYPKASRAVINKVASEQKRLSC